MNVENFHCRVPDIGIISIAEKYLNVKSMINTLLPGVIIGLSFKKS